MHTAKRLEGINEYYFSQKLREIDVMNQAGRNVINLGIGSPDLPPHHDVIQTLHDEALKQNVHGYQNYKGSPLLRNAIATWYKRWYDVELDANTEILPLIGSKEGIMHICMTYLDEGKIALIPNPGYPTYRSAVTISGGTAINYDLTEESGWYPDLEAIKGTLPKDRSAGSLMFLNYPHMPTGKLPSAGVLESIVNFARENNILLIHDNPYSFILNENPFSILSIEGAKEVAIELNSLSKSHNMAGWRVGMMCGSAARINEVLKFKTNMDSGMFLPVQLAAAKALSLAEEWHAGLNMIYKVRQQKVFELLDLISCRYDTQQAGLFVWAKIPAGYKNGYALADEVLNQANVFLTPGGIFGTNGDGYVRVSLCADKARIEEAIERIRLAGKTDQIT